MRLIIGMLFGIILVSSVFAFSDVGLLDSSKSISYFLMPSVAGGSYSSGIVYQEERGGGVDLEFTYTSYNSMYLITTNVTQLGLHARKNVLKYGIMALDVTLGLGGYYSPAVGGGVTGDIGEIFSVDILDGLAFALPVYVSIFNDGYWLNMFASLNFKIPNFAGYEAFFGYRMDYKMLGSLSFDESSTGSSNSYYALGLRTAL